MIEKLKNIDTQQNNKNSFFKFKNYFKNKIKNILNTASIIGVSIFSVLILSTNITEAKTYNYKEEINKIRQQYLIESEYNLEKMLKNKRQEINKIRQQYLKINNKQNYNSLENLIEQNILFIKNHYKNAYNDLLNIYGNEENIKKELTISTLAEHVGLKNIEKDKDIAIKKISNNTIKKDFEKDNSFGISRIIPDTVKEINKKYKLKYTINDILNNPKIDILYGILSRVILYNYLVIEMKKDKQLSQLGNEKIYKIAADATKTGWVFNRGPGKTIPIIKKGLDIIKSKNNICWIDFVKSKMKKDWHIKKIDALRNLY